MLRAAGAVHMTMRPLFGRRIPYAGNLDIERERLSGKRMVGIDIHIETADFDDRHLYRSATGLQSDDLARLETFQIAKVLGGYAL